MKAEGGASPPFSENAKIGQSNAIRSVTENVHIITSLAHSVLWSGLVGRLDSSAGVLRLLESGADQRRRRTARGSFVLSDVRVVCYTFCFVYVVDPSMASSTGSVTRRHDVLESGADRRRSKRARGVCDVLGCAGCLVV